MDKLIEVLGKDTTRTVILIGIGVIMTKIAQMRRAKAGKDNKTVEVEF